MNTSETPRTEEKLQLALAKMLPDQISISDGQGRGAIYWTKRSPSGGFVRDTEWLHVCWLVEETLIAEQRLEYVNTLFSLFDEGQGWDNSSTRLVFFPFVCANWQHRAEALCKVKGITI